MIISHIALCVVACLQLAIGHPVYIPQQFTLPMLNDSNPIEINNLSILTAETINQEQNEDIDLLIEQVKQVTSRYRKDVDGTIAEVQQILNKDYSLPRLTRGEIVEILDNLTKTDIEELRKNGNKTREDYQRALMLVMPYTPKGNYNTEELYTKPPITHLVGASTSKSFTPKKKIEVLVEVSTVTTTSPTTENIEITQLETTTLRVPVKRPTRPRYTKPVEQTSSESGFIVTQKPKKQFITNKQTSSKSDIDVSTHKPFYNKPLRLSNHKYPDLQDFQPSNQGLRIVSPPSLVPKSNHNNEDLWQQKPNTAIYKVKPTNNKVHTMQSSVYKEPLTSTARPRYRTTTVYTSTQSPFINIGIPEDMKDIVKDLEFAEPAKTKNKFSSQYDASEVKFPKKTVTENIQDILGSIGMVPTTNMPDLTGVADTLSPDMKELLMTFGLIQDPNRPAIEIAEEPPLPEQVDIHPMSYSRFKPLPDSAPGRDDMTEFLATYGLTGNSQRAAKTLNEYEPLKHLSDVPSIDLDMIPASMHEVLEDIGLSQRRGKRIEIDDAKKTHEKSHVFNPDKSNVSDEELRRLNQLVETLKRLEKLNRTVTEEDFKDIDLKNIAEITKILGKNSDSLPLDEQIDAPNPLDFDLSAEKNEVKRQEITTEKVAEVPSTEVAPNPSLEALAESFGGTVNTKVEDATLPPPRKTGFYYLVDWNTFLEVGEEGKNKVNIRFSPNAGDSSRFLRVNVP